MERWRRACWSRVGQCVCVYVCVCVCVLSDAVLSRPHGILSQQHDDLVHRGHQPPET